MLEKAYEYKEARQNLVALHFSDNFIEAETMAELLLVHLHGFIRVPEKGYVFSRSEYINNIRNISHWMIVLAQFMQTEPLVIAGTALDEVDLEFYLSHRTVTSSRDDRGPSILVEMADDAITQDICKRHGLLHFVGYPHDFFSYCAEVLPNRPTPYELIPLETLKFIPSGVSNAAALAFQSDFEIVPAIAQANNNASRFHYGYPPIWSDFESDNDIPRPIVSEIITKVEGLLTDAVNDTRVFLVTEIPGAGKTTILKRTAFELARRGIRVLMHNSVGGFSKATGSVIDLMDEPVVLIVDNFADHASYVVDLLSEIEKKDAIILATERSYRLKYLKTLLYGTDFMLHDHVPLREQDVARLIEQYLKYGLIGDHNALKQRADFGRRALADPIAIVCCRIMNDFKPLDRIVRDLLRATSSEDLDRYIIATIARSTFSGGVRDEILRSAVNNTGFRGQLETPHPLPLAYSDREKTFIIPFNSTLGDRVLTRIRETDRKRLLKCFVALANAVAPRVNRSTIIKRLPEARMVGRLFDYDDVVSKWLQDEADNFYDRTRDAWKWNSRYWGQVALLNLAHYYNDPNTDVGNSFLTAAVQHARHGVSIELHPFPLTTLGTILMAQMVMEGSPRADIFEEALQRLGKAIELESQWWRSAPQPYFSLFNGIVNYLDQGGVLSTAQTRTIKRHIDTAETRFPRHNDVHRSLGELQRRLS